MCWTTHYLGSPESIKKVSKGHVSLANHQLPDLASPPPRDLVYPAVAAKVNGVDQLGLEVEAVL